VDPIERTPTEPADYAALSAGNDLLQTAFQYLCAHATAERKAAQDPTIAPHVQRAA
jgi:hypothetical protein